MIFPKINRPNGNFRWWNGKHRLWNAVPAELNHWSEIDLIYAEISFVGESRDSWKLFRRLFLIDNISGRQEASKSGKHECHSNLTSSVSRLFTFYVIHGGPVWARECCGISPPRFLAECHKK